MAKPKIIPIKGDQIPLPLEKPKKRRSSKKLDAEWVRGSVLMQKYDFSDDHMKRLRDEGLLKRNLHWKNIGRPQAARPTYRYHMKRCEEVLETLEEMR
jgi:hypothetical protein